MLRPTDPANRSGKNARVQELRFMSSSLFPVVSRWAQRLQSFSLAAVGALALSFGPLALPVAAQDNAEGAPEYAMASELAAESLLLDATYAGDRLIAVGEFGHIVLSDDRGATWRQAASVPTQATLTGVTFIGENVGFAVGHDATILRTTDAGENWELVYNDTESEMAFMTVYFESEKRGFAMGAFSFVVETNDGGETWEERSLSEGTLDDFHLNKLFA